ncbi:MAG: cation:proton antiporter, partial [Sciscionella sp.]|nr:cation:proton antiporter [Sciscionella sp.]
SGANDPVGIALMASVLTVAASAGAGAVSTGAGGAVFGNGVIGNGVLTFAAQLIIGAIGGLAGGFGLRWLMRHLPLPSGALYPLRTLAAAIGIYGVCTIAHGSGFLAVFIAGILVGDERAPYKGDIERVHAALASLAEIVAFTLLGLTIDLTELARSRVLLVGLALAALLALVIRPLLVGPLLLGVRLKHGERLFVLFAGLKGAVPILLGSFALTAHIDGAARIYHVIACVVVFSVIVQGGLVPTVARLVGVPMRTTELEPWALGVRLRHEPTTLRRYVVGRGASAVGSTISELPIGEQMWISMVIRDGRLVPVSGDTVLAVDDEVLALVDGESEGESDRESDGESDRESGGESDRESGGESGADPGALFRSPRP